MQKCAVIPSDYLNLDVYALLDGAVFAQSNSLDDVLIKSFRFIMTDGFIQRL